MKIVYRKKFQKSFKKLALKHQKKVISVMEIFEEKPRHKSLRRHKLQGKFKGKESLDVTGNLWIIIEPKSQTIVDVIDVGSHSQLY